MKNVSIFKGIAFGIACSAPVPVFAHGWVTNPPSRQEHCVRGTTGFDCGDVRWEPQSVEARKGSNQCNGGGSRFSILNENRNWPTTDVHGRSITFTWKNTAPHRTSNWVYHFPGVAYQADGGNAQPPFQVSHTINNIPAGRYTILAVWNIADTVNAFYNCIDVNVF